MHLCSNLAGYLANSDDFIKRRLAQAGPSPQAAGATVTGGSGASLSPNWPTHATNDIGVLIVTNSYNTTTTPGTPAGWNLIGTITGIAGGVKVVGTAWWKRAASGAESAPSVTTPATDPCCIAQIVTIRGAVTSGSPIESVAVSGSQAGGYPNLTVVAPGGMTQGTNRLAVNIFCAFNSDGAQVLSGATNASFTATELTDTIATVGGEEVGIAVITGPIAASKVAYGTTSGTSGAGIYTAWANISFAVRSDRGWAIDTTSDVPMPLDAIEYPAWVAASAFSSAFPTPASLYRDAVANASLVDRIGSRTLVLTGSTAVGAVTGWSTPEVHLTGSIDTCWFQCASENLTTTAVAAFAIVEFTGAAREESVISLGGVGVGNCLEARMTAAEAVKAVVQGATATGPTSYTGQVVGIFIMYRPGSNQMSVMVKPKGSPTETVTPTWAGAAAGGSGMYVLSGWNNSSSSKLLRFEYWTGTDADNIGAAAIGEFFTRRGF